MSYLSKGKTNENMKVGMSQLRQFLQHFLETINSRVKAFVAILKETLISPQAV